MSTQIFPLNEIAERAKLVSERVKTMDVFSGHITRPDQKGMLQFKIVRDKSGQFNPLQLQHAITNMRGDFTVICRPTNETFHVSSKDLSALTPMNGFYGSMFDQSAGGGMQMPGDVNELVNRLINAEALVRQLSDENEKLRDELEQFETNSGRLTHSLNNLLEQFIFPKFGVSAPAAPMNGTQQQQQNMAAQERTEQEISEALHTIIEAFGVDWVCRFAATIKGDAGKVQQIKTFFP